MPGRDFDEWWQLGSAGRDAMLAPWLERASRRQSCDRRNCAFNGREGLGAIGSERWDGAQQDDRVVRRAQRKVFHLPKDHVRYELLSPDLVDKQVEFYRVELDPHPGERPEPYSHEGEEYGIVVEGKVAVWIEGATSLLQEHDSIFFRATSPHYVSNAGRHTAVTIWAISPPAY